MSGPYLICHAERVNVLSSALAGDLVPGQVSTILIVFVMLLVVLVEHISGVPRSGYLTYDEWLM